MRVILKDGVLALASETPEEEQGLATWCAAHGDHVFRLTHGSGAGAALSDLGPADEACRTPINIVFSQSDPAWQPISNLAHAPFTLHGRAYASVEGFWQGLKLSADKDRARLAGQWGLRARQIGQDAPQPETFRYEGREYAVGGHGHHTLMLQACEAKFTQNLEAREALLATGDRPLTHRVARDSKTIPGALLADIWMRIRARLRG